MKFNSSLFRTLIIGTIFVGIVAFLIPFGIFIATRHQLLLDIGTVRYGGMIPLAFGAYLSLWCVKDFVLRGKGTPAPFDPPGHLVVQGFYRYVRNPMYIGLFIVLIGEAVLFSSIFILLYSALAIFAAHVFVVFYEEPTLRRRFGNDYEQYSRLVPRWLPRIPKRRLSER